MAKKKRKEEVVEEDDYPTRDLVGYQFPIKIIRKGKLFDIYNEITMQAVTVDKVAIVALKNLLPYLNLKEID